MKQNYKTGEKIKVTKVGMFKDLEGVVLSNNTGTSMKPLTIILTDLGTWSFAYCEVIPLSKESSVQVIKTPKNKTPIEHGVTIEEKAIQKYTGVVGVRVKRPYVKKDTSKPQKQKRKYVRKEK